MSDRLSLRAAPRPATRVRHRDRRQVDPLTAAARTFEQAQRSNSTRDAMTTRAWQKELWQFYDTLGEYNWSVEWLVKALSRVRLVAGEQIVGDDEPTPIDGGGPAGEQLARLGGGPGGISALMADATAQISVPGEGWLVGDVDPGGAELCQVYSTEEIRQIGGRIEVQIDDNVWGPISPNAFVTRIWNPSRRLRHQPMSPAKAALPVMRRLDLLDRRIVTTLVSRIAMNGLLLIPEEGTVSTPSQYADAADPFVSMLMDIGSNNMKSPGSASAALPLPIKFPAEFIEKWRHLALGDSLTTELLDERDRELRRLATAVNVPAEIVLGMGDSNHWTAWQLEESAIKMHVAPMAEIICHALTIGFLHPMLRAAGQPLTGPNGGLLVVWYDTSELTQHPDKSDQAFRAYDRLEIGGATLRREVGFDESDAPTKDDIYDQILKQLARSISLGPWVLEQLTGRTVTPPQRPSGSTGGPGTDDGEPSEVPAVEPDGDTNRQGPPATQGAPPPDTSTVAALAALLAQAGEQQLPPLDHDRPAPAPAPAAANGNKPGNKP